MTSKLKKKALPDNVPELLMMLARMIGQVGDSVRIEVHGTRLDVIALAIPYAHKYNVFAASTTYGGNRGPVFQVWDCVTLKPSEYGNPEITLYGVHRDVMETEIEKFCETPDYHTWHAERKGAEKFDIEEPGPRNPVTGEYDK